MTIAVKRTPSDKIADKPTSGRGILGPVAQARKNLENGLRSIQVQLYKRRTQLLELYGRGQDRPVDMPLSPEQLQELNAIEERGLAIATKLRVIEKDRNASRSKSERHEGGAARHGMPGTVDVVGKLRAMKELLHATAVVIHDAEGRVADISEFARWDDLRLMQKVADYDRKTRDFSVMILRAAEGDAGALREFYGCYCFRTLPLAKQEGSLPDRFAANMIGRTPENRAELIYRWSGMNREHCELAAKTPADVPIVEINQSNLSFIGNIRPLIENALRKCKLIVKGTGRITGLQPRDPADVADRTSYVTRKNKDYARN